MKKLLFLLLVLTMSLASAISFTDDFERADLTDNGWATFIEASGGTNGIVNGELVISNGNSESIGDNFAYIDLDQKLTSGAVTGVMNYNLGGAPSNAFYIGINAIADDIYNGGEGANYRTSGKGYGIIADFYINEFIILDQTATDSRNAAQELASGPLSFNVDTDVNFELLYENDGSLVTRFWNVGSERPDTASFQYNPGKQPLATGTNLFFGITDEGTLKIDDLLVATSLFGNVPEPSAYILFSIAAICVVGLKKNRK